MCGMNGLMMMVYGVGPWNRRIRGEDEETHHANHTLVKILGATGSHGRDDNAVVPFTAGNDSRI